MVALFAGRATCSLLTFSDLANQVRHQKNSMNSHKACTPGIKKACTGLHVVLNCEAIHISINEPWGGHLTLLRFNFIFWLRGLIIETNHNGPDVKVYCFGINKHS